MDFGQGRTDVEKSCLLLDSSLSCSLICNVDLLLNIHHVEKEIKIKSKTGWKAIYQMGYLHHYNGLVWYCSDGVANLLGLSNPCNYFQVEFDCWHYCFQTGDTGTDLLQHANDRSAHTFQDHG